MRGTRRQHGVLLLGEHIRGSVIGKVNEQTLAVLKLDHSSVGVLLSQGHDLVIHRVSKDAVTSVL